MKKSLVIVAAIATLGLAACVSGKALTFNEDAATGYAFVTSIDSSLDTLLLAGKITSAQAASIETQAENLKQAIDTARTAYTANAANGGNQLATALTALNSLSTYVATLK